MALSSSMNQSGFSYEKVLKSKNSMLSRLKNDLVEVKYKLLTIYYLILILEQNHWIQFSMALKVFLNLANVI